MSRIRDFIETAKQVGELRGHLDAMEQIASLEKRCEELENVIRWHTNRHDITQEINLRTEVRSLEKENARLRKVREVALDYVTKGQHGFQIEDLIEALSASERGEK
jgi:hypothetical protein